MVMSGKLWKNSNEPDKSREESGGTVKEKGAGRVYEV